jgi:hypothetical protein
MVYVCVLRLYGTGLDNDDEIQDFQARIIREQQEQARKDAEMRALLDEEQRRRDAVEASRLLLLEQQRLVEERAEERAKFLKHVALIKEMRQAEVMDKENKLRAIEEDRLRAILRVEAERVEAELLARMRADVRRENAAMAAEEQMQRLLARRRSEIARMEHEDIRSVMFAKQLEYEVERRREIEEMCREVYEPFVPFQFPRRRVLLMNEAVLRGTENDMAAAIPFNTLPPVISFKKPARIEEQELMSIATASSLSDRLQMSSSRRLNSIASLLTLSNEQVNRLGLHSSKRDKRIDADYLHQLKEAQALLPALESIPKDFEVDAFYLEACRPGLREAGYIESPILPQFAEFHRILRMPTESSLPPLSLSSSMPALPCRRLKQNETALTPARETLVRKATEVKDRISTELQMLTWREKLCKSDTKIAILGASKPIGNKSKAPVLSFVAHSDPNISTDDASTVNDNVSLNTLSVADDES